MKYKKQKFPFTQSFIHITKRPGVVLLLSYTRITEIMQHLGTNISRKYNYKKKQKNSTLNATLRYGNTALQSRVCSADISRTLHQHEFL